MISIQNSIRDEIFRHVEMRYPEEACGFLLGDAASREARLFVPTANIQNELHARDPERYPRTAATAYAIAPDEFARIQDQARAKNLDIVAIVHSHPDHDAYFSDEDKTNAAPWGEPLFPGVSYIVLSVEQGRVKAVCEYSWDDATQDFLPHSLLF